MRGRGRTVVLGVAAAGVVGAGALVLLLRDDARPAACDVLERPPGDDSLLVGGDTVAAALAPPTAEQAVVFLVPGSDDGALDRVADEVAAAGATVDRVLDAQAAYDEFVLLFEEQSPELIDSIDPSVLPPNVVASGPPEIGATLAEHFAEDPAVREVSSAGWLMTIRVRAVLLRSELRELTTYDETDDAARTLLHAAESFEDSERLDAELRAAGAELADFAVDECDITI